MSDREWWEKNGELADAFAKLRAELEVEQVGPDLPPPEEMLKSGITTRSTLDHRSKIEPTFEPEPTPDDPGGMETARRKAIEARDAEISRDREKFEGRAEVTAQEFNKKSKEDGGIER